MALPASFTRDGFLPMNQVHAGHKFKHIMIGSDGWPGTGKTEFALSAPGPGIELILDRGVDSVIDNPNPPASRNPNFGYKVIKVPLATQVSQADYLAYWRVFYDDLKRAVQNPDARTIIIDGDSDSWELQRLAEFGRISNVPPHMYVSANAARRAMYAMLWDSGKIVIATNKLKEGYESSMVDGKEIRAKTGSDERQGFSDQEYLWHMQLRHLYEPSRINKVNGKEIPGQWGLRIMLCKANKELEGQELWGTDCNFQTLMQLVYPHIPLERWGY